MPLSGLTNDLTFERFIDDLRHHQQRTNEEIRILAYITDLGEKELYDSMQRFGFDINRYGAIVEVITENIQEQNETLDNDLPAEMTSRKSVYYCYYDTRKNLLLCFTYDTLEEVGKRMDKYVNQKRGIAPLWIHPLTFNKVRRQIVERNTNVIINEFHASRVHNGNEKVIRDNYERYFQYNGDDGLYTLEEIWGPYGVLPNSIVFTIPNVAKFRITSRGRFTFIHGRIECVFEILNEILTEVLMRKSILDKAKTEVIPVNWGKKELKLPNIIPIDIVFSRDVEFAEVEKMVDNMIGEDFNFEILDMLLIHGSVHLSGTVFDKNKNVGFNITLNSDRITVSPKRETDFDSMLQFYRMITERLDLNARLQVSQIVQQ
jgi:hypothetical protein